MGPPRHHATLGACPGTPRVRCCAAHAFPLPPFKWGCYIQFKGYFRLGGRQSIDACISMCMEMVYGDMCIDVYIGTCIDIVVAGMAGTM